MFFFSLRRNTSVHCIFFTLTLKIALFSSIHTFNTILSFHPCLLNRNTTRFREILLHARRARRTAKFTHAQKHSHPHSKQKQTIRDDHGSVNKQTIPSLRKITTIRTNLAHPKSPLDNLRPNRCDDDEFDNFFGLSTPRVCFQRLSVWVLVPYQYIRASRFRSWLWVGLF